LIAVIDAARRARAVSASQRHRPHAAHDGAAGSAASGLSETTRKGRPHELPEWEWAGSFGAMSLPRYALYVTLPPENPLARFGANALGYACEGGKVVAQTVPVGLDPAAVAAATAAPSRYGFHATIMAPFRLAPDATRGDLIAALQSFANGCKPCPIGALRLGLLSRFIALVPLAPTPAISAFAADALAAFDAFRAPPSTADRERRIAAGLSARQLALLDRWGYPYVLEEFRFHMTLAGPLPAADCERWLAAYQTMLAPLAHHAIVVDALSLLSQEEPDSHFRLVLRQPLTG
jgi:Protein of unknown function (DUF1045)